LVRFGIVSVFRGDRTVGCPGGFRPDLIDDFHDFLVARLRSLQIPPSFLGLKKTVICGIMVGTDPMADMPLLQYRGHKLRLYRIFKNRDGDKCLVCENIIVIVGHLVVHGVRIRIGYRNQEKLKYYINRIIVK
jgi:hypothetical protein